MNRIIIILFLTLSFNSFSQSQTELNIEAAKEYKKADNQLNEIYHQILIEYKTDKVFIENFKKSQRNWIVFRDSEMELKFPKREQGYYGSVHPTCLNLYLKKLTETRAETLKIWLDGIKEGDACNGSVKRN